MARHLAWRRFAPLLLLAASPSAFAFDYGSPILVRSESDIIELEYSGEIDEELRDQLLDLFDNPLDLNTASREDLALLPEITYGLADRIIERRGERAFENPRQVRDVVGRSIYNQIKPFVITMKVPQPPEPLKGVVSARYLDNYTDEKPPVLSLKAKVRYQKWLEAGVLVAEEQGPYGVEYFDEAIGTNGERIGLDGMRPVVSLERVYAKVDRGDWGLIMGHYSAGFGQRLTFYVTDKQRPHGFYQDLRITEDYEGYDSYSVSRRLMGVAATMERHIGESGLRFELTGFASSNPHDLYQNYFAQPGWEEGPKYVVTSGEELANITFPWVYREDIVGFNATLFQDKRIHAGVTAWGGHISKAFDFEFRNIAMPNRDFYGALGVDGAYGVGIWDLLGEVALTDTGGVGARAEGVVDPGWVEASVAMRYYGEDFDNPHSRGKSEPDQYSCDPDEGDFQCELAGGYRDRDEVGPQVQLVVDPYGWIRLRAKGDVWYVPSKEITHAYLEGRLDLDPTDWLGLDIVAYLRDKDISQGGREQTYDDDYEEPAGAKEALGGGFTLQPVEPLILQGFAKWIWEDRDPTSSSDIDYEALFMRHRYAWGKIIWDVTDELELTLRGKVYEESVRREAIDLEYWSAYAQARGKVFGKVTLLARYEQEHVLYPELERLQPNFDEEDLATEHKLKVGVDYRF